jgi:hypothetical protein
VEAINLFNSALAQEQQKDEILEALRKYLLNPEVSVDPRIQRVLTISPIQAFWKMMYCGYE